jgi:hypothetical protein
LADAQFDASSLAALTLLPTVFVAWADGWVTAEELATAAMDHIFEDFRRRMPSQTGSDSRPD